MKFRPFFAYLSTYFAALVLTFGGCDGLPAPTETHQQGLSSDERNVWTQHNDNLRSGTTLTERSLTTTNVSAAGFGKLFARQVDDQIYAQPLHLAGVGIAGGLHNVVYVATVNNSIYAFDADDPNQATALATVNLGGGNRAVTNGDVGGNCGNYQDFSGRIGIVGTPVIDVGAGTLYVVARTFEANGIVQRLHALDVTNLAERPGSPVIIAGRVPGTGDGNDGNGIPFDPAKHNQRAALLLSNGVVYIAWASYCDTGPYHGWVIGYRSSDLSQSFVWNSSPDGGMNGIWQGGQGLAADDTGKIYFMTGNGTANAPTGGQSYGESFVKLDPGSGSPVADWFMPFNADSLNASDADLGSAGLLLIPGTQQLVGGGKEGKLYLLDRNNLGHFHAGDDSQIQQSFPATGGHIHGSPIYWSSASKGARVYVWSEYDYMKAFAFDGQRFATTPVDVSNMRVPDGMPGGFMSISANGNADGSGILWAAHPASGDANHATRPGILRAFDASNVKNEVWNSLMNPNRDDLGNFAKFCPPTVANGKVFLATFSNQLVVYGLLSNVPPPAPPAAPGAGTGLHADYFTGITLGTTVIGRVDATVNFDWGNGSPDPAVPADQFSARWTGQVQPLYSEAYTFYTTSDDGVRLWVNGNVLVDNWTDHGPVENFGTINLTAGQKYDIKMEYYENGGGAQAKLSWSSPSAAKGIIPTTQLYPAAGSTGGGTAPPGGGTASAYIGCYADSNNRDLSYFGYSSGNNSTETCVSACKAAGYKYAGTQYSSECYCGNTYGGQGTSANCNMACSGNGSQTCGGPWANSVSSTGSGTTGGGTTPPGGGTPALGTGTGLHADYFNGMALGTIVLGRVDATVNFDWGNGSPDPAVPANLFSVRWTGQVQPLYSETYSFYTTSDDGVRLWVNGNLLVDNWTDHGPVENVGTINLTARQKYDLKMEFYENGGGAQAKLLWSSPSAAKGVIPATQLYPAAGSTVGGTTPAGTFVGCFTDSSNRDLSYFAFSGGNNSTETCVSACKAAGYKYAGTQYASECYCGNTYGGQGASSNCTMACAGNGGQICGGPWANSVYTAQ